MYDYPHKKAFKSGQKILSFIFLASISTIAISFVAKNKLPQPEKIVPQMQNEPIQGEVHYDLDNFTLRHKKRSYVVRPIADYQLWGMVVTHNNINAFTNMYHNENSLNIKDICVIWGENITNRSYLQMKFKSGEYTCYPDWKTFADKAIAYQYNGDKLSNNHLLARKKEVLKTIEKIRIGDQVYLKGMLVDYAPEKGKDYDQAWRKTSISREDLNETSRSGGACEVFFVEEIKILKQGNAIWYLLYDLGRVIILLTVILKVIIFFYASHVEYQFFQDKNNIVKEKIIDINPQDNKNSNNNLLLK